MRTEYFCEPYTLTSATPSIIDRRCASKVSAYSSTFDNGMVCEVRPMKNTGASAGLTLRNVGGTVIVVGNCFNAAEIADCTSSAAASMLRSSVNCSVIWLCPMPLVEVIESSAGIEENCFSSGVATAEAIVSGDAPGSVAVTWIVGKSTLGRSDTGSRR